MPLQVIQPSRQREESTAGHFASAIGNAASDIGEAYFQSKARKSREQKEKEDQETQIRALSQLTGMDLSGIKDQKILQKVAEQGIKQKTRMDSINKAGLGKYLGRKDESFSNQLMGGNTNESDEIDIGNVNVPSLVPDEAIYQAEMMGERGLSQQLREHNKQIINEAREKRKTFESDRKHHTQFSKKAEEEVEAIRSSIGKKENSLNFARDSVESGNLSYFSKDKLADATGVDFFRTAKGAQLVTAAKENLLSNLSRVTGRAQNMWFEQRMNSMFPKIGQSKEANLTVQEMLEGEVELDKAYLNEFDKLAEEDQNKYGYVRKDIARRAKEEIKPVEKQVMQRTSYRMKEIEEQENGLQNLKKKVGKNVIKGTPFTLAMAKLYRDKYGENALNVAKKNGYNVPKIDEYKKFRQSKKEEGEETL